MSEEFDLPPGFGCISVMENSLQILKSVVAESENRLYRLHAPIEDAIRSVTASLEGLPSDSDDSVPAWETLLDEGTRYIEDLLGMAFVVAQTQINAVVGTTRSLSRVLHQSYRRGVRNVSDLLDRGHKLPNGVAAIKFANAVADFWKHRDQWDDKAWSWLDGRPEDREKGEYTQAKTAVCLRSSGLTASSTGQIRQLATFFGIEKHADLDPLRRAVHYWGQDLVFEIEQEFKPA